MLDDYTRAQRRLHLGSSDAAAICGRDPWRTAGDVWAEKTGRLESRDIGHAGTVGTYLEGGVLDWAAAQLDTVLARDQSLLHPGGILIANLDALALAHTPPAIVEAKTSGLLSMKAAQLTEYGEPGTDQVPESVLIQVHHQFAVVDAQPDLPPVSLAFVAALLGGRGLLLYRIERNDELLAAIVDEEQRFWRDYVLAGKCPPDAPPSLETLTRMRRVDGPAVPLDHALVSAWLQSKEDAAAARAEEEARRRDVLAALGDGTLGSCPLGEVRVTQVARKEYTVKASTVTQVRFKPADAEKAA